MSLVLVLAVVLSVAAWVGALGLGAKSELEAAVPLAKTIKSQVLAGDSAAAMQSVATMGSHTARARELTSDPVWRATEALPFLGPNLSAVRELATVADQLIDGAVKPLARLASTLDPETLKPVNGSIDLEPIVRSGEILSESRNVLTAGIRSIRAIDTIGTLGQVSSAVRRFEALLTGVSPQLSSASELVNILPEALGVVAPRNYVIVFENNAEARALGGTSLSFVLMTVDKGAITLGDAIPAGFGNFAYYQSSVIPMPDGVAELYGSEFGRAMSNVTVRPSFDSAAHVTQEMWKRQFGVDIDGLISVDPVALGYLLRGTAAIPLSTGDILTSDTLVPLLLNSVYMNFWSGSNSAAIYTDAVAQDAVYAEIVEKTADHLMAGNIDPKLLMTAVTQAVTERRLLLWSPLENEQAVIESLSANGALPQSDTQTDRVGVYFQENVGSKMNYYLKQAVSLGQAECRADGKASYRIGVDLTNGLPLDAAKSVSPSILGEFKREKLKPGVQRMIVMVYAPPGSQIVGATVDGAAVQLEPFHDTDYPVAKLVLTMNPGATSKLSVDVVAAGTAKKVLSAQVTPMVNATAITDVPLDCASVAAK